MSTQADRRATGANRIQFDALVEVGGELGPPFEAQAVNLSEDGMQLRTAYLPEVGQYVSCRFDAGQDGTAIVRGQVLWNQEMGEGGEFGIRFMDVDPDTASILHRMLTESAQGQLGAKIRLHIEGLAAPMRARVRDTHGADVIAYSDLGFLQFGKTLDLEDAGSGGRRPAHIDRVQLEVDAASNIPQLVICMKYDDQADTVGRDTSPTGEVAEEREPQAEDREMDSREESLMKSEGTAHHEDAPPALAQEQAAVEDELPAVKGAVATQLSKVTPAMTKFASRTKTALALMWAKHRGAKTEGAAGSAARRTTSPPPSGVLHASGRKVVRDSETNEVAGVPRKFNINKRYAAIGAGVGVAALIAIMALRKPATPAPLPAADPVAAAAPAPALPPGTPDLLNVNGGANASGPAAGNAPVPMTMPADNVSITPDKLAKGGKPGKAIPFGNGPVGHGTVLKLKMDGPVEKIQGAPQPTGFTVVIPGRHTMEPAAPLASRDGRIAALKASNDPNGTELTLTFKDGVPNYQVRAKGDTLEIAIAPVKKDEAGGGATTNVSHKQADAHTKKKKKH